MTQKGEAIPPSQTEFHRIYHEWTEEVNSLAQDYPITAAVVVLAGGFFGFFTILHFSLAAMISGAFFLTIAATTGLAIQRNWDAYWKCFVPSIVQVKNYLLSLKAATPPNTNSNTSSNTSPGSGGSVTSTAPTTEAKPDDKKS